MGIFVNPNNSAFHVALNLEIYVDRFKVNFQKRQNAKNGMNLMSNNPELPALMMELKWNKSAETAIEQMKEQNYIRTLENYTGEILLVGINYSKTQKQHQCIIEKYVKK